jgi:hypothetical protein
LESTCDVGNEDEHENEGQIKNLRFALRDTGKRLVRDWMIDGEKATSSSGSNREFGGSSSELVCRGLKSELEPLKVVEVTNAWIELRRRRSRRRRRRRRRTKEAESKEGERRRDESREVGKPNQDFVSAAKNLKNRRNVSHRFKHENR